MAAVQQALLVKQCQSFAHGYAGERKSRGNHPLARQDAAGLKGLCLDRLLDCQLQSLVARDIGWKPVKRLPDCIDDLIVCHGKSAEGELKKNQLDVYWYYPAGANARFVGRRVVRRRPPREASEGAVLILNWSLRLRRAAHVSKTEDAELYSLPVEAFGLASLVVDKFEARSKVCHFKCLSCQSNARRLGPSRSNMT